MILLFLSVLLQLGCLSWAQVALQDVPEGQYLLPVGAPRARLLSALPTRTTRGHRMGSLETLHIHNQRDAGHCLLHT